MNIYSFEFGADRINWFINEYKNMKFLGTTSRRFQGNRNFIRIDDALTEELVTFKNSTYHSPAVILPDDYRCINHNENMNVQLLHADTSNTEYALAIIIIDYDYYRLVDYMTGVNDSERCYYDNTLFLPEIKKVAISDKCEVALIQFDVKQDPEMIVPLIMFNRITKSYEYHTIYTNGKGLRCDLNTSKKIKDVLREWEDEDRKRRYNTAHFHMELNQPSTKYFVTTKSYETEMKEVLSGFPSGAKHRIFTIIPDSEFKYPDKVFDMISDAQGGKKDATTFYRVRPVIKDNMRGRIPDYIFIMDETGTVRTI